MRLLDLGVIAKPRTFCPPCLVHTTRLLWNLMGRLYLPVTSPAEVRYSQPSSSPPLLHACGGWRAVHRLLFSRALLTITQLSATHQSHTHSARQALREIVWFWFGFPPSPPRSFVFFPSKDRQTCSRCVLVAFYLISCNFGSDFRCMTRVGWIFSLRLVFEVFNLERSNISHVMCICIYIYIYT